MLFVTKLHCSSLRENFTAVIRPTMLYGIDCWAVHIQQENKFNVVDMRMLHWMNGHTRQDWIKNE